MKKEVSCGAVSARRTETAREILLSGHATGGHGGVPKGHVEANETETETALREIREETGLDVTLDTGFRTVVTYSPKPGVMKDVIYFAAELAGADQKIPVEEITGLHWASPNDAASLITYENDRNVLAQYRAYMGI